MKVRLLFSLVLILAIAGLVSANECTDNSGVCVPSCSATYGIKSFSCEGAPITSFCCTPLGDFTCQNKEGYVCSTLDFKSQSMSNYKPEDYGLREATITEAICPYSFTCYKKNFKVYNGAGNYSLMPGDEIHFTGGNIIKYYNFIRGTSLGRPGEEVVGNMASLYLYNGDINYSNFVQNQVDGFVPITNTETDKIKTFAKGFYLYADHLNGDSNVVNLEVFTGVLSSCTDTDAYTIGNTVLEAQTGSWGRNYYAQGTATELKEDSNGATTNTQIDVCSNGKLTEYYCKAGQLKSEEKTCTCKNDVACEKGFFDSIWEWFGKRFGTVN